MEPVGDGGRDVGGGGVEVEGGEDDNGEDDVRFRSSGEDPFENSLCLGLDLFNAGSTHRVAEG